MKSTRFPTREDPERFGTEARLQTQLNLRGVFFGSRYANVHGSRGFADENITALYREYGIGPDHGNRLLWAALHANQSWFEYGRSRSHHRSSVDQSLGYVSQFQQCMVRIRPKD